jgi:FkbM family methyltransferase
MISYAQNLEDVVLNRVFQNKPKGFYIDVGAHDPIELSVTKHFFDLGWHGINIEPVPASYKKFKKGRPDDINLNIAVGSKHDFITIYEIEGHPELTSLDKDIAESTGKLMDAKVKPYKVEIRTLTEVCDQYCNGFIDFIKIDVEGFEKEVILGTDLKRFRPTMLVVEATKPCKAVIECWDNPDAAAAWHEWEPLLFEAEYILIYYDGLNRYYLRKEDEYLKNRFAIPVTWIQDQFSLYRDVRKTWRLDAENKQLEKGKGELANQFDTLTREHSELLKERDQLKNKETELEQRLSASNDKHNSLMAENKQLEKEKGELAKQFDSLTRERSELLKERDQLKNKETEFKVDFSVLESQLRTKESEADHLTKEVSAASQALSDLRAERNQLDQFVREKDRKLNTVIATLREERLSARRNPLAKLLLPIRSQLEVQPKRNDIGRGHSQLPQITSRMENEARQDEGHISDLELRIEHLEKSIGLLERLRRHNERFLASKVSKKGGWPEVGSKLEHGEQLKVVFINDMGLLYGAGIGLRRQVEGFLKAGHKVACVAWLPENLEHPYFDNNAHHTDHWQGMNLLPEITELAGKSREFVVDTLTQAVMANDPDVIIAGNFHGVGWGARGWPLEALENLHQKGMPVVAYAHDCYWATGACAYTGTCSQYLTGCDGQRCPKPEDEYPFCPKSEIKNNWQYRRSVFAVPNPIPIATNSTWTNEFFLKAYNGKGEIQTIHLGVNVELFKPIDKKKARGLLGLSEDGLYIAIGAVNLAEDRKGGKDIDGLLDRYAGYDHITWLAFGDNSHKPGVKGFGRVGEKEVCLIFNAADLYVNLAKEEAFGQTLMEASACGCPLVTYNGGGMTDIARDGQNAMCVETGNLDEIVRAIEQLRNGPDLRAKMGRKGREIAVEEFSFEKQYENWKRFFEQMSADSLV